LNNVDGFFGAPDLVAPALKSRIQDVRSKVVLDDLGELTADASTNPVEKLCLLAHRVSHSQAPTI
jgi:expansin (peptidoglycan-binding protein)